MDRKERLAANAPSRWGAAQWAAMAACLIAGVLVGRTARAPSGPIDQKDGALVVRGALAQALDRQLALDSGPIRIGITFRDAQGHWCRTFESVPDRLAGLACRDRHGWAARTLAAWSPGSQAGFRTVVSKMPQAVTAAVDQTIAGIPVDQAGEQAARKRDWKP